MQVFDVFNGDADGILSLVQLRLAEPCSDATLVTGSKRDIELLNRVNVEKGDKVTVLDISMRVNMPHLNRILKAGAHVFYLDHHNPGNIPDHSNLIAVIDTSPEICTAMLVNEALDGEFLAWAVTAAFGDNFPTLAHKKAAGLDLPLPKLERLGTLINYNGYGASIADLHFDPADLYQNLVQFKTPMEFLAESQDVFQQLDSGYKDDMAAAKAGKVIAHYDAGVVIELPDLASSRRVSGVFGNMLAQTHPERAHAILTHKSGGYVVSVRAPLARRTGADTLCLQFETGGGRSAAAGINHLPTADVDQFVERFLAAFA